LADSQLERHLRFSAALLLAMIAGWCGPVPAARAAAPTLFRTPGYQAPVRGDPDDLLMLAGTGFDGTDRVVYAAVEGSAPSDAHPDRLPDLPTVLSGTAQIVSSPDSGLAITVRLPVQMQPGRAYRLWVVTAQDEWSRPATINDPRPLWFSPAYAWSAADIPGLGRAIRVIGRNLSTVYSRLTQIRLQGLATYVLPVKPADARVRALPLYAAEAVLPARMAPGTYTVSIRRSDGDWIEVPDRKFEVRPDPGPPALFRIDDPAFGGCRAGNGADDSPCLAAAIAAAARAGGGNVVIPAGRWRLSGAAGSAANGFVLPPGTSVLGAGAGRSVIERIDVLQPRTSIALLTLTGRNTVTGLTFRDGAHFTTMGEARPVIRLGPQADVAAVPATGPAQIADVVIADNQFDRVGKAISDEGQWPLARLIVSGNEFAAFGEALFLGGGARPNAPFRVDDSVIRGNHFIPGSYVDIAIRQGTIASEVGAADRLDFSDNIADGADTRGLDNPRDQKGFRAAFFWNMQNNVERLLVSRNRISCSGDKAGDGEALSFDDNGSRTGFAGAPAVGEAGPDWVRVRDGRLLDSTGQSLPRDTFYLGQWVQVVGGPGLGQVRRIVAYREDPSGAVTLQVAPQWDVVPASAVSRVQVAREMWQAFIVDNDIESGSPPCAKSNLTDKSSGRIVLWLPSADSVVEGNVQHDSSGILFRQAYQANTPSCPSCQNVSTFQSALEIRNNRIDGEYDWSSDCSLSGITGDYSASPTPESPPSVLGFGVAISHNAVTHADGLRGGAVDFTPSWYTGPAPGHWPLVENPLVFHNDLRDIDGPPPRPVCHYGGRRIGIQLGEPGNVTHAVLYSNQCRNVSTPLHDAGSATVRLCPTGATASCECPVR
jgi:hypothetical protein